MLRWGFGFLLTLGLGCRGEEVEPIPSADGGVDTATTADIGAPPDADADTASAGLELLQNPGFELGCGGWETAESTADESTVSRTGSACRICGTVSGSSFFYAQFVPGAFVEGTQYFGEAWLRADDGDSGTGANPVLRLELVDKDFNQIDSVEGNRPSLDGTWRRSTSLIRIKPGTIGMRLELQSQNGRACYLVDDASLHVVK